MSLYADYIKERQNIETLECEKAFVTYEIYPDLKELYLMDVYVDPKYRRTGILRGYFNKIVEIAKEANCNFIMGSVDMSTKNWQKMEKIMINEGFDFSHKFRDNMLFYKKDVRNG